MYLKLLELMENENWKGSFGILGFPLWVSRSQALGLALLVVETLGFGGGG